MRIWLLTLLMVGAAQADPYRQQTAQILRQTLDPGQYARLQPLLEERFDARGELKLTAREAADLQALFAPAPADLQRRLQQVLWQQLLGPEAPTPTSP